MKRKILLIACNARFTHSNPALYALRTSLNGFSCNTDIREFSIQDKALDILLQLQLAAPQVIAFSVYIWNSILIKELLPDIKKVLPGVCIILGGPEVSYNASEWLLAHPEIDYIVSGEGETAFRFLAENNFSLPEKIISLLNPPFANLPFPYQLTDAALLKHKYLYYEASRGCPFECSYCLSSRLDQPLQYRTLEQVKQEIRQLWEFEPFLIKFIDRSFNVNSAWARSIWEFLIAESPAIKYHFEIHPAFLEAEDFALLTKAPADLFQFEIGIQTIHTTTLAEIGRTGNWEQIKLPLQKLREIDNIHQHYDAIAGLPGEDMPMLAATVNELLKMQPHHLQLGFLKVLPGTKMRENAAEYGMQYQSIPPYGILGSKQISFSELAQCTAVEDVLELFINSGHFISLVEDVFQVTQDMAFENLLAFAEFADKNNLSLQSRQWLKKAQTLQAFYTAVYPHLQSELDEKMVWEWCRFPSTLAFPDFLPPTVLQIAKQSLAPTFKQLPSDHPFWQKYHLQPDDLRRAIFFQPLTARNQNELLAGHDFALWLKEQGKTRLLLFDIQDIGL
jgi:radical SAM superfamily enzyme YgiQ (UPF0313 family)